MTKPVTKPLSLDDLLSKALKEVERQEVAQTKAAGAYELTDDNKIKVNLLPHELGAVTIDDYVPALNKQQAERELSVSEDMLQTLANRQIRTMPNANSNRAGNTSATYTPPPPPKPRVQNQVRNLLRVYTMFGEQPEFLDIMVENFLRATKIADNITVARRFKSLSPYTYLSDVQGVRWYATLVYEEDQTEWDQVIP